MTDVPVYECDICGAKAPDWDVIRDHVLGEHDVVSVHITQHDPIDQSHPPEGHPDE